MRSFLLSSFLAASISALFCPAVFADFDLGLEYYEKKDFENAYKKFLEAAKYGDYDAQSNVGAMHYRGEHVAKDIPTAYAWMALSAQATTHNEANETPVHKKIYARMNDADKKRANEIYEKLYAQYNDTAIEHRLTPVFTGQSLSTKNHRALKKVAPEYPNDMLREGKVGFVDMVFTIDKNGITRDHLTHYTPSKSFEKATIKALRQFQYEPMMVNGKPVAVTGVKNRFHFSIEGSTYDKRKLTKVLGEMREKAEIGTGSDKLQYAYFLEVVPSFAKDYELSDNPNEWYVSAANQGSSAASYFLGRNILYGNMCSQDSNQSMGWLLKAAKAGVTDAQYMLATESFTGARYEKDEAKGFYWLARAAELNNPAKVRYAWILATHPDQSKRNGKLASQYLNQIDKGYADKQSYYQTHAAVAAENGDFNNAIKWQKEALDDAKELELPLHILEQQLASYTNKKPWREEI